MTGDRTPPNDQEAERAALGAAMLAEHAARILLADTEPGDFYSPGHQVIRQAIGELWDEGTVVPDPILVANRLAATNLLETAGGAGALSSLLSTTPATNNASTYCLRVVEAAMLRRLIQAGAEAMEAGYRGAANPAAALDAARATMDNVSLPVAHVDPDKHVLEILQADDSYDWLLDGLLEKRDRAIFTAPEGMGKSTLLGQIAMQAATGIVPFSGLPNPDGPVRTLVIDLENSERQIARKMRTLYRLPHVNEQLNKAPQFLRFAESKGLDLTSRTDRRWLFERMEGNKPQLVIIGPIYKMLSGNPNDEGTAKTVIDIMDECRDRWGITLLMEAHSPHGSDGHRTARPVGASIWKRWPEFGIGLLPCGEDPSDLSRGEVVHWRGPREEREGWPAFMHRNPDGRDGGWPWISSAWPGIRAPEAGDPGPKEPAFNPPPPQYKDDAGPGF